MSSSGISAAGGENFRSDQSHHDSDDDNNPWASLPSPLNDIFLQDIAPVYLGVRDFIQLSKVSRRYRNIFHPRQSPAGNNILRDILLRDTEQKLYSSSDSNSSNSESYLIVHEQLPTIGSLSTLESLARNALFVAKMQSAALRRRALIRLDIQSSSASDISGDEILQEKLQQVISKYKAMSRERMPRFFDILSSRFGIQTRFSGFRTQFLCINKSGVDIYCHWIDDSGEMLSRDGDRIPPMDPSSSLTSFTINYDRMNGQHDAPPHVFSHTTCVSHSFALCFQQGGPPFAIYQVKQSWFTLRNGLRHIHAIAVLPGGQVEELYCDSGMVNSRSALGRIQLSCVNIFRDRNTRNRMTAHADPVTISLVDAIDAAQVPPYPHIAASGEPGLDTAEDLSQSFYGVKVPPIDSPMWRNPPDNLAVYLGSRFDPINYPTPIGNALVELGDSCSTGDDETNNARSSGGETRTL